MRAQRSRPGAFSRTIFTTVVMGTAITAPSGPHIQPQKSIERSTVSGDIPIVRPRRRGSRTLPHSTAITSYEIATRDRGADAARQERDGDGGDHRDRNADGRDEVHHEQDEREEQRELHAERFQHEITEQRGGEAHEDLHDEVALQITNDAIEALEVLIRVGHERAELVAEQRDLAQREERDEQDDRDERRAARERVGCARERLPDALALHQRRERVIDVVHAVVREPPCDRRVRAG